MIKHMNQTFYQKNMAWVYILILSFAAAAHLSLSIPIKERAAAENIQVIPNEAIRLRILANSDGEKDQAVKRAIRDAVNKEITAWVEHLTSIEEARALIRARLPEVENIARQELKKQSIDYSVKVEFGNVQFPTKLYGEYLYPAGTYEAILITLGEGRGANWWCVLFPPLCFLDFSTGAAVDANKGKAIDVDNPEQDGKADQNAVFIAEEKDEPEVKFLLKELFGKWL
jgi:stage II sporulation protein R